MPWQNYAVELDLCGTGGVAGSLAEQTCNGDLVCTCASAPPVDVEACVSCHMLANENQSQRIVHITRALSSYADLCGDPSLPEPYKGNTSVAESEAHEPESARGSTSDDGSFVRREVYSADCIFGVPAISELTSSHPAFPFRINDRRLLYGFAFCLVAVLCLIERRRK
ncbi:hypothetical protein EIP86_006264 [Pleurotus ostreatoroseus]|nr:hypothetical protein EIP86_006264 [Pleurotus ostreatoroseus]